MSKIRSYWKEYNIYLPEWFPNWEIYHICKDWRNWSYGHWKNEELEVYKIILRISSVSFDTFFEFHQYGQTRGHSFKLMKKRASTDLRHHFFSERVINTWNSLDDKTVISESLNIFKRNLERVRQSRGSVYCQLILLDLQRLSRVRRWGLVR